MPSGQRLVGSAAGGSRCSATSPVPAPRRGRAARPRFARLGTSSWTRSTTASTACNRAEGTRTVIVWTAGAEAHARKRERSRTSIALVTSPIPYPPRCALLTFVPAAPAGGSMAPRHTVVDPEHRDPARPPAHGRGPEEVDPPGGPACLHRDRRHERHHDPPYRRAGRHQRGRDLPSLREQDQLFIEAAVEPLTEAVDRLVAAAEVVRSGPAVTPSDRSRRDGLYRQLIHTLEEILPLLGLSSSATRRWPAASTGSILGDDGPPGRGLARDRSPLRVRGRVTRGFRAGDHGTALILALEDHHNNRFDRDRACSWSASAPSTGSSRASSRLASGGFAPPPLRTFSALSRERAFTHFAGGRR